MIRFTLPMPSYIEEIIKKNNMLKSKYSDEVIFRAVNLATISPYPIESCAYLASLTLNDEIIEKAFFLSAKSSFSVIFWLDILLKQQKSMDNEANND